MVEIKNKRMVFACWSFFWLSLFAGILAWKVPIEHFDKVIEMYQVVGIAIVVGFLGAQTMTDHKKLSNGTTPKETP